MSKKKTFDITKPGKSAPSSTGRPIIVTNRSIVKDPTLKQGEHASTDPEVSDDDDSEDLKTVSNQAKDLEPVEEEPSDNKEAQSEEDKQEQDSETDKEDDKKSEIDDSKPPETNLEIDASVNDKKRENKQTIADKNHQEMVEKLVAEGKYVIPIGQSKQSRNTQTLILLIIVSLIVFVIIGDLLIDSGAIKTNAKPIVNLINN
ncbi:MAG TPA: hypothetical protein VLF39_02415 [Candidatus Saccharimonadales bacterium]|nr:hypothetical protein [Candidatus Saccharimonadales bacterium]